MSIVLQFPIGPEIFIILGIIYLLFTTVIMYYVYNDSKNRDEVNTVLWVLLIGGLTITTFVGGLLSLLVYLMIRD